jgi:hypothetical protein
MRFPSALPIPNKGQRSWMPFFICPMAGVGLVIVIAGPENQT